MFTDVDRCLRAAQSKDARFDGWFFTAVVTTGMWASGEHAINRLPA